MNLPNAAKATVLLNKMIDYLLNLDHPDGAAKAKFFMGFGYDHNNVSAFEAALLAHPNDNDIVSSVPNEFGTKYIVECHLQTPDGRNPCIRSVWMDDGVAGPRLVSAYPFR